MKQRIAFRARFAERMEKSDSLGALEGDEELLDLALSYASREEEVAPAIRRIGSDPEGRAFMTALAFERFRTGEPTCDEDWVWMKAVPLLSPALLDAREHMDRYQAMLVAQDSSCTERIAGALLLLAFQEPKIALLAFSVTFLDEFMRTGDAKKAFDKGTRAFAETRERPFDLPARPPTRGKRSVLGNEAESFEPYSYRYVLDAVLKALALFVKEERRLLPWLFEGAKIWCVERETALAGIRDLPPTREELREGFAELVGFAKRRRTPDARGPLLSALKLEMDPVWLFELLSCLDEHPSVCEALSDDLYFSIKVTGGEGEIGVARLVKEARQPIVRAIAFAAVGSDFDDAPAQILESDISKDLRGVVIRRLVDRRRFSPRLAAAVTALLPEMDDDSGNLRALAWNCRQANLEAMPGVYPGTSLGAPRLVGDKLVCAYHRVLTRVPPSEWSNDEDQFGVFVIDPQADPPVTVSVIPRTFPVKRNGANLAKRRLEVACVHDGALFVVVSDPFSDSRGWGTENYLFSFNPSGVWRAWSIEDGALRPIEADVEDAPSAGYGELIVWKEHEEPRVTIDGTPYHLDDWEHDIEVSAALEKRAGCQDQGELPQPAREVAWEDLAFDPPPGAPALRTKWAGTWAGLEIILAECGARPPDFAVVCASVRAVE